MQRCSRLVILTSALAVVASGIGFALPELETNAGAAAALGATNYVALGDSYSAGYGNPGPYLTQSGTSEGSAPDDNCNRASVAYPLAITSWLKSRYSPADPSFTFLACSGATTSDLSAAALRPLAMALPVLLETMVRDTTR